ncbi:peptidase T [Acidobacteria bacterium Mor1]|nr:peptidase T [Acidobacteria bacterium Mor1]
MSVTRIETSCVERFLRYVTVDTQSCETSTTYPSTEKQFDLLRMLVEELRDLGVEDAEMDRHGYVFGTVPATTRKAGVPTIGFLAHVDTSPEMSGAGVKPIVHRDYQGKDLVLPDDPEVVIRLADNPHLNEQMGNDIITASGKTLLGADNKAGVAEIMGAVEYLMAHPEIPHGPIRVGFTPDEEVGRGTKYFDVERFGALCAYTMDGETLGELQMETFSADSMVLTFHGVNAHPGYAKGRMVSALKLAADFVSRLPRDGMSPETTEGKEGFVFPYVIEGGTEAVTVRCLIRDFHTPALAEKEQLLDRIAREVVAEHPPARVEIEISESYRNMKEVLDRHPKVVDHARQAIERVGLPLRMNAVRGGTDGAALSFKGLPTPNIFAGEHNFHSRYEWVSVQDMHRAVEVIVELCKIWEEAS